ncbi:MAG: caspase family protein [Candidatus Hodarchaeota archaeon]
MTSTWKRGTHYAILIGASEFTKESTLDNILCPSYDLVELKKFLKHDKMFDKIIPLLNESWQETIPTVNRILAEAEPDDFVLIYYSGHGKRSKTGKLHLALKDTEAVILESTSLSMDTLVHQYIKNSDCTRILVILDCCYSGLAGSSISEFKSSLPDELQLLQQESQGMYLLTSSTAYETSKCGKTTSLYTTQILKGLLSKDADVDGDGYISASDLDQYLTTNQYPPGFKLQAKNLIIAKGKKISKTKFHKTIDPELYLNAAENMSQKRKYERALELCEEAIKADNTYTAAYELAGNILLKLNRLPESITMFEKANISIGLGEYSESKISLPLFLKWGIALNKNHKWSESSDKFEQLLDKAPEKAEIASETKIHLAFAYEMQGKKEKAKELYGEVLFKDFEEQGRNDYHVSKKILNWLEESIVEIPGAFNAFIDFGSVISDHPFLQDWVDMEIQEKAIELNEKIILSKDSTSISDLISSYYSNKKYSQVRKFAMKKLKDDARSVLSFFLSSSPVNSEALKSIGFSFCHNQEYEEALQVLEKVDERISLTSEEILMWCRALRAQGRDKEAINKFKTITEPLSDTGYRVSPFIGSEKALDIYNWGQSLESKGLYEEALQLYSKAYLVFSHADIFVTMIADIIIDVPKELNIETFISPALLEKVEVLKNKIETEIAERKKAEEEARPKRKKVENEVRKTIASLLRKKETTYTIVFLQTEEAKNFLANLEPEARKHLVKTFKKARERELKKIAFDKSLAELLKPELFKKPENYSRAVEFLTKLRSELIASLELTKRNRSSVFPL